MQKIINFFIIVLYLQIYKLQEESWKINLSRFQQKTFLNFSQSKTGANRPSSLSEILMSARHVRKDLQGLIYLKHPWQRQTFFYFTYVHLRLKCQYVNMYKRMWFHDMHTLKVFNKKYSSNFLDINRNLVFYFLKKNFFLLFSTERIKCN